MLRYDLDDFFKNLEFDRDKYQVSNSDMLQAYRKQFHERYAPSLTVDVMRRLSEHGAYQVNIPTGGRRRPRRMWQGVRIKPECRAKYGLRDVYHDNHPTECITTR